MENVLISFATVSLAFFFFNKSQPIKYHAIAQPILGYIYVLSSANDLKLTHQELLPVTIQD